MQGLPPGAGPFCGVKGAKTGHTYPCRPRNSRKIAVFHPEWAQTLLKREKIWYTETIDETRGWEREDAERRRFEEKGEGPAAERAGPPAGTRVQAPEGSGGGGPGPGGGSPCPQDPGLGPGGRGHRLGRGGLAGSRLHPAGQLARQLRPGGGPGAGTPPAPAALPGSRLLFLAPEPEEASALPAWAPALAAAGLQRDFGWKSWGALSGAALFRPAQADAQALAVSYEDTLDSLRVKLDRAEQSCRDYQKLTEHQRSELSAAHEHESQLENALTNVTGSTCWKATWPVRYLLSKLYQLWHTFPLFVLLAQLRHEGFAGLAKRRRDRQYYQSHFPGQTFKANRLAPIDLLVRQAQNQPNGPKISIVVPLYNTPLNFLAELLDSVVNHSEIARAVPGGRRPGPAGGPGRPGTDGRRAPDPVPEAGQK